MKTIKLPPTTYKTMQVLQLLKLPQELFFQLLNSGAIITVTPMKRK